MRTLTMLAVFGLACPAAADPLIPDFAAASFPPDAPANPYFPLTPGPTFVLVAEGEDEGETFTERTELSIAGPGPVILGVQTTAQRDMAYEDDLLVEETLDYYAADAEGNVWYFGEDVINYVYDDAGTLVETNDESAWMAGVEGALPGWMMPASPVIGWNYYQEVAAAADALDQATVHALGETVTVAGVGAVGDVVVMLETTELEPDAREFKYYAPGLGLIRIEEGLDEDLTDAELVFELVSGP